MAMVKCPQCGQDVSENATKCVHCGLVLKSVDKERINKPPKQLFDEACEHYKQLTLTIRKVGLILESLKGSNYSTTTALCQMDYALQFILLLQAASDGEVDHFEQQFIDLITDHGDLLVLLREKYNINLSWDSLELYNNKTILTLLSGMTKEIAKLTVDFVRYIAFADAGIKEHNFYADIRKSILNIADCLACIDEDDSDNIAAKYFDMLIGNTYLKIKNQAQKEVFND